MLESAVSNSYTMMLGQRTNDIWQPRRVVLAMTNDLIPDEVAISTTRQRSIATLLERLRASRSGAGNGAHPTSRTQ